MSRSNNVFKSLLYASIFDYPLKKEEVWRFLISSKKIDRRNFEEQFSDKNISSKDGFYFLKGKEDLIKKRLQKERQNKAKIAYAIKILKPLFLFPTIKMIGISGSLAMLNSEKKEDIDIFIISRKNNLWITRLFLITALKILGKYRGRGSKNLENLFCLNMLVDEERLEFKKSERNLYLAHEIAQLRPLFQRDKIYEKFMPHNNWIKKYLPNIVAYKINSGKNPFSLFLYLFDILKLEFFAKKIQINLMQKKIGREKITDKVLAFHPRDRGKFVLKIYTRGH